MGLIDIGTMIVGGRQVLPTVLIDSSGNIIDSLGGGGGGGIQAVRQTDGTNLSPIGVVSDPIFTKSADDPITGQLPFRQTDGTNNTPIGDTQGRAINVIVGNGTQTLPSGDGQARVIHVKPGDGTTAIKVATGSTEAVVSDVAMITAQRPSEVHLGEVGGNTLMIKSSDLSFAVTASSAYVSGYLVGQLLDLGAVMRKNGWTGILQSINVKDRANQKPKLQICVFDAAPAGTFTEHAAFPTLTQADLNKCIRMIAVLDTDYTTVGGAAMADLTLSKVVQAASGSQHLWIAVQTLSTPTFAATTDLQINFGFLRD